MRISYLALALTLGAAACAASGFAVAQEASPRRTVVSEETLKDVEIMRRVLLREGLAAPESNDRSTVFHALNQSSGRNMFWHSSASGAEAFVVPGQGATFVLRTSDPVSAADAPETETSRTQPSAWDEEAAALEGRRTPRFDLRASDRYDAAKVDALKTRLLDVLAKYGQKVRGLGSDERLTVIVVGSGGAAVASAPVKMETATETANVFYAMSADRRTVLSIHTTVADCQAAASGSLPTEQFRRRATISAY